MIYSGKVNIDQIIVSDPCYEKGVWCRYENDNLDAKNWDVDLIVDTYDEMVDGFNIKGIDIRMMLHDSILEPRMKEGSFSYPRGFTLTEYTIGMDSASMSIGTNETADKIRAEHDDWYPTTALKTLQDGCFGNLYEGAGPNGNIGFIYLSGFLDEDTGYSIQDVLSYLENNMHIQGLTPNITADQTEIETFLVEPDGINVSLATWFDVDDKFGTHVNGEDDHWVNFEATYNPETGDVTCKYAVDTPEKITDYDYQPSVYERDMLKTLIEDYCQKEENKSALELYEEALQEDSMWGGIEQ